MLDTCITCYGVMVDNMLQERDELGQGPTRTSVQRYKLSELLDPEFVYPQPQSEANEMGGLMGIQGLHYDEVR